MITHRRAVVLLVVAAAVFAVVAPPASADKHEEDLIVVFTGPGDGATLGDSSVTVTGRVEGRQGLLNPTIDRITVTLVRNGGGTLSAVSDTKSPPEFEARFTVPRNGRYTARVEATGKGKVPVLGVDVSDVKGSGERSFGLAAPPRAPQDVRAEVLSPGVVTVSWIRNAEPDMLHYEVSRKAPGSDRFEPVGGRVSHPASGERVAIPDNTGPAGGDFTYRVVAVRQGADEGTTVRSNASAERTVAATPGAPGGPGDPGGAPSGAGDAISNFLSSQRGSSAAPPRARTFEAPDTGFSENLPFGARPPGELEEGEEAAEPRDFEVVTPRTEFVSRGRPLVPIAAGAILLLLAVHLRLLNKRVKDTASAPAVVSGPAHSDLAPLDMPMDDMPMDDMPMDDMPMDEVAMDEVAVNDVPMDDMAVEEVAVNDRPLVDPYRRPRARAVLYDYEAMVNGVDDDVWAERDWDDGEIREVVVPSSR
jgi:hypothetical protein